MLIQMTTTQTAYASLLSTLPAHGISLDAFRCFLPHISQATCRKIYQDDDAHRRYVIPIPNVLVHGVTDDLYWDATTRSLRWYDTDIVTEVLQFFCFYAPQALAYAITQWSTGLLFRNRVLHHVVVCQIAGTDIRFLISFDHEVQPVAGVLHGYDMLDARVFLGITSEYVTKHAACGSAHITVPHITYCCICGGALMDYNCRYCGTAYGSIQRSTQTVPVAIPAFVAQALETRHVFPRLGALPSLWHAAEVLAIATRIVNRWHVDRKSALQSISDPLIREAVDAMIIPGMLRGVAAATGDEAAGRRPFCFEEELTE